jgi:hypothetical protein
MRSSPLTLPGVLLIERAVATDPRGVFFENWNERDFAAAGIRRSCANSKSAAPVQLLANLPEQQGDHDHGEFRRAFDQAARFVRLVEQGVSEHVCHSFYYAHYKEHKSCKHKQSRYQ